MDAVQIVEVGPRDGLQNEAGFVETADKLALIDRLVAMGATRIEVASFVNPRRVPQMADAEAIVAALPAAPGVRFIGLCLNERGVDRAIASRDGGGRALDEAGCVLVASDGFGIANQGQTVADGITVNTAMLEKARGAGLFAQVTISAAFGCPYDGPVPAARVIDLARRMADAGAQEIALADTIGVAVPAQVGDLVGAVIAAVGPVPVRLHLHDTRGMAPGNAWAAYQAGCRTFDAALGGLGGCPFAPGAAGNVGTEDLVYLFERSGVRTGITLDAALAANHWFAGIMGRPLPSRVGEAGDFAAVTP
ncbi:hydroxymethylglutaryl-CoA lyase [Polymorphobacter fuscus]|uniref:Hydroxymethylglutaryl-CoA lyase n=1 Tax=Sandarakinorhabdus fusca TaxID=1439888 RepID=A0A7C9GNI8_9SPHN|nr:hydroxymethylglutaryl-CoA lyase [Polymorphobacter fuscus]KAB7647534.1 hydroxymethylglutaryl-CoA lyase [Polymorphobacter fuscus]MQT16795.1 hydroxymethylglutaryl-CoA lyase [Polymorphobacter fuscus]NJC09217.1 hydroxymethylglutaryl-CoA lyase [Polymorphobacter fuscus]